MKYDIYVMLMSFVNIFKLSKNLAEMANPQDLAGKEINGYRVLKPIGQGKFSIVFKGERISDGRIVALKQIKV